MSNDTYLSTNDFWSYQKRIQKDGNNSLAKSIYPNVEFIEMLSKYMCTDGTIEIIACEVFKDEEFKNYLEGYFGSGNVKGYTTAVTWGILGVSESKNKKDK